MKLFGNRLGSGFARSDKSIERPRQVHPCTNNKRSVWTGSSTNGNRPVHATPAAEVNGSRQVICLMEKENSRFPESNASKAGPKHAALCKNDDGPMLTRLSTSKTKPEQPHPRKESVEPECAEFRTSDADSSHAAPLGSSKLPRCVRSSANDTGSGHATP